MSASSSITEHHTAYGTLVNRTRYGWRNTIDGMLSKPLDTKVVLWQNVRALMMYHYKDENLNRLVRDTKIGNGTATRIKAAQTAVGIDVLEKISRHFDLQPWHLLLPNLDPGNAPVFTLTETEEKLYRRLKRAHEMIVKGD